MAGKLKQYIALLLIVFLILHLSMFPMVTFADEVTPTSVIEQTQESVVDTTTTVDNSVSENNNIESSSNTGDNTVNPTPTLTLTPTPVPIDDLVVSEPSITPPESLPNQQVGNNLEADVTSTPTNENANSVTIDNISNTSNNITSEGNSGENQIATTSAEKNIIQEEVLVNQDNSCGVKESSGGSISTGNAVSETTIDNSLNTNSINSQAVYQTINIFVDANGNLNLSDPFVIASSMIPKYPNDEVINVAFTNVNNYAYLSNNIVSYVNSGNNTINGNGSDQAIINTGDSYSIVSLLNKVNFTVVNSVMHIVSINIFGKLNGDIILPDINSTSASCATCGISLVASNSATVVNDIDSKANSGQNTINGSGSIVSGKAGSVVNNLNLINTNFVSTTISALYINLIGSWIGDFIGWGGFDPQTGGAALTFYSTGPLVNNGFIGCSTCATGNVSIYNSAYVENNISSLANSGGNIINGNGNINTGNTFSTVSLINFVNANFINSVGFFGFLNIFGEFEGNIGGKNEFDQLNQKEEKQITVEEAIEKTQETFEEVTSQKQEEGGMLSIAQSNNVGQFVYPGDTVTFFIKVKNTGKGKVYGAKLNLFLVKDGESRGGGVFNIGDIEAGKSYKITTGLVLSKSAEPGEYIAVALAKGNIGPDNNEISTQAQSSFKVFGNYALRTLSTNTQNPQAVLGSKIVNKATTASTREMMYFALLIMVIAAYLTLRVYRKREYLGELFAFGVPFKIRLNTLRMFLL
ncbi:MAG: hypothetical protein AAB532_01500 [Patescibacteria group bacterium]|mgnify:CR=1 FL=1